jgi:putative protein-disulfide isomerase
MTATVRVYTDPACPWSWGAEPKLRRLSWELGESIEWRFVMGGLARSFGPEYRDTEARITGEGSCFDGLMANWLEVAAETGMPTDPRIWRSSPLSSTYPACQGVKAASDQGVEAAGRYLRRAREAILVSRTKLDHTEALAAVARNAGLDLERFRIDLASNATVEAFAADLDEVRTIPDEARAAGKVATTEGRERLSFPSTVFIAESGERHGVWGSRPFDAYREAALAAGAEVVAGSDPDPVTAIERFGRCATKELELLTGKPRPVLEADLWALARDWRLRPISTLTGTLWELP